MSSAAARERWRHKRTQYVLNFCTIHEFKLERLNEGYQLRIEGVMDVYPTNGRWHFLPTGERGDWHTENDLKLVTLEMLDKVAPKTYDITKGEQPIHGVELTGVNKVTVYPVDTQPITSFKPRWYQGKIWHYLNRHMPKTMIRLRWRGRNHL